MGNMLPRMLEGGAEAVGLEVTVVPRSRLSALQVRQRADAALGAAFAEVMEFAGDVEVETDWSSPVPPEGQGWRSELPATLEPGEYRVTIGLDSRVFGVERLEGE